MCLERGIRPVEALVPEPGTADLAIESAVERDRARVASLEADGRVERGCARRTQLGWVVEREVGADDGDAPQTPTVT